MGPDFYQLQIDVLNWAANKGILRQSDPKSQLLKTISEIGELADAVNKDDPDEFTDAVGDVLVTLIILCELKGYDPISCLEGAYNEISGRTGQMINGVFIKDV